MKKICLLLATCAIGASVLLTLTACGKIAPTTPDPSGTPQGNTEQTAYKAPQISLDTTFNSLMDGLLADGGENSCVSPLSFKLALAMAYNGAEGGASDLLAGLFGVSASELNTWAAEYLLDAKQYDGSARDEYLPTPELRIANSYWLRKGLESEISKDFTIILAADFNAESGKFDNKPDPINKWVSDATNGKIKDILAEINPNALSYLVNALYFKAQWVSDFNENATAPDEFTNFDGSKITTDMLHGGANSYINTEQFEGIVKHLYGGFEFTAVMPKTSETVTLDAIAGAEKDDTYTAIFLTLPKFDFDTSVNFKEGTHPEFDVLFAHHGMDGALSETAETNDLLISEIVHKTTFTLAEAGIEASAATVIAMEAGAAAPQEPKEVEVVFDKPFYFALTDRNGEVLFVGKTIEL
jgi:serpin B